MKIYNTLTNKKEAFEPLENNLVRMYVCGVTAYDDCHLGHARSAIVFDVIRRYLTFRGYQVKFVRNFTDIDDKILNRAVEEGIPWNKVSAKYIEAYSHDMNRLQVSIPDVEPRATDHMQEITEMIKALVEKGHAYQIDGDVYYHVPSYADYGRLARRNLDELQAGARVEVDERKRDPMDFALWKGAKPEEPAWQSPWGPGRPGWHIECSAMSIRHLGETFDLHGGGKDLIFPHHENEIAQSSAVTGKEFAKYWLHNGMVTVDEEKMSKSLGNFFTIKDIFTKSNSSESITAETLRYFLLSTHYRSDLNFSNQAVSAAKAALDNLYGLFQRLEEPTCEETADTKSFQGMVEGFKSAFLHAMDDDFNTPKALGEIQRLRSEVNGFLQSGLSKGSRKSALETFRQLGEPLGLFQMAPKEWEFRPMSFAVTQPGLQADSGQVLTDDWIERQVQKRVEARERKDFATADQIRKNLAAQGITIEDRPDGTSRWKR